MTLNLFKIKVELLYLTYILLINFYNCKLNIFPEQHFYMLLLKKKYRIWIVRISQKGLINQAKWCCSKHKNTLKRNPKLCYVFTHLDTPYYADKLICNYLGSLLSHAIKWRSQKGPRRCINTYSAWYAYDYM